MKYVGVCLFLIAAGPAITAAQTPGYWFGSPTGRVAGRGFSESPRTGDSTTGVRHQSIYYPTDFPGAPAGNMTHIYFRYYGRGSLIPGVTTDTTTYYDLTVKMGYTELSRYKGSGLRDTFITAIQMVHFSPAYVHYFRLDTPGKKWIRLPLNTGSFAFSKARNFVVEISTGPPRALNGIVLSTNYGGAGVARMLSGSTDSMSANTGTNYLLDFGFDVAATGIEATGNIRSVGVFPNPTTDGRFNVSFNAGLPVRVVLINVTNVTGQTVYSRQYHDGGSRFFEEVHIGDVPKGLYFVRIVADGEQIVRRMVVD